MTCLRVRLRSGIGVGLRLVMVRNRDKMHLWLCRSGICAVASGSLASSVRGIVLLRQWCMVYRSTTRLRSTSAATIGQLPAAIPQPDRAPCSLSAALYGTAAGANRPSE